MQSRLAYKNNDHFPCLPEKLLGVANTLSCTEGVIILERFFNDVARRIRLKATEL